MNISKAFVFFILAITLLVALLLWVFVIGESNALFFAVNEYKNKQFEISKAPQNVSRVYVGGAVQNAGFYTVTLGEDTYEDVLTKAGLLSCSIIENPSLILNNDTQIICSFMEEGKVIYPINVNSDLFISIYQHANIKTEIATKIEQYRKTVSKIESLQWLLDDGILTPMEWQDTFFRIYVG